MAFMAHHARARRPADTAETARRAMLAKRGDSRFAGSRASVSTEPVLDYPHEVHHLREWVIELHGRSGATEGAPNQLTYSTVRDWARLTGRRPLPHEVHALLELDAVLCHPGEAESA
jgi:hypothetical protein